MNPNTLFRSRPNPTAVAYAWKGLFALAKLSPQQSIEKGAGFVRATACATKAKAMPGHG